MPVLLTRRGVISAAASTLFLPNPAALAASSHEVFSPLVQARLPSSSVVGWFAVRMGDLDLSPPPPPLRRSLLAMFGQYSEEAGEYLVAPSGLNGTDLLEAERLTTVAVRVLAPRALREAGYDRAAEAAEAAPGLASAARVLTGAVYEIGRRFAYVRPKPPEADLAWGVAVHAARATEELVKAEALSREGVEPADLDSEDDELSYHIAVPRHVACALARFLEEGQAPLETQSWTWEMFVAMIEHALAT